MANYCCAACGNPIVRKDVVGLNRKLLARDTTIFYCMSCLAENLDWSVAYLEQKIDEFKEQGCTLFQ